MADGVNGWTGPAEPTIADPIDPVALEARLKEARARRATALAARESRSPRAAAAIGAVARSRPALVLLGAAAGVLAGVALTPSFRDPALQATHVSVAASFTPPAGPAVPAPPRPTPRPAVIATNSKVRAGLVAPQVLPASDTSFTRTAAAAPYSLAESGRARAPRSHAALPRPAAPAIMVSTRNLVRRVLTAGANALRTATHKP